MRHPVLSAVVLAALISSACDRQAPSDAQPSTTVAAKRTKIRFVDGINTDVRDVPLLMAFDDLEAHGYEIEKTYIDGNAVMAAVLARGDADVGIINNQSAWAAIAAGGDIRTVSDFARYTALLVANEGVRTCRDLGGRPVGLPGRAGFAALMFDLYMARACPDVKPELLVLGEATARASAILSGRIDAAMVPGEELLKLQQQSGRSFRTVASFADEFPGIRVDGLQVNRAWAERHTDTVRDLVAAQLRAQRLVRSNPQVLYDESVRRLGIDFTAAKTIGDTHLRMELWDPDGALTPENIQATIDLLAAAKAIPSGLTAERVADLSYLHAARAELNRR